jgi:PAS domain-containing protein
MSGRHLSLRILIGVSSGLLAIAIAATIATVWALRNDTIEDAMADAGNIASVLAEESARSVQAIELMITEIQAEITRRTGGEPSLMRGFVHSREAHEMLAERRSRLSQIDTIALVDANGQLASNARGWPVTPTDVNDREYFQHFRNNPIDGFYISKLTVNRVSGEPSIFFVRRIRDAGGEFGGVILIGVKLAYFQHIYNSVTSMRDQAFVLLNRDGTVMIRHPAVDGSNSLKLPPESPWHQLVADGGGEFRSPGYFTGEARLVAVRPLKDYPIVVNVSFSESAALERWRQRASMIALIGAIVFPCAIMLLWLLNRHGKRLIASQSSLTQRETKLAEQTRELANTNSILDSALRDMSQGLTMFDGDGKLVVFNDRYLQMYSLTRDEVRAGMTLQELLNVRRTHGTFNGAAKDVDALLQICARNLHAASRIISLPIWKTAAS